MAQKIQTLFIDDIDGSAAEGTIRFGIDGNGYEIDLSAAHAADLRAALAPFIAVSRKAPGSAARRPGRAGRKAAGGISTTQVREWARTQGIEVKDRGRVPAGIVARYHEATGK
ncbi:MAG TPA: Lsr2 family protein [Streptosporangiaceae bacterium]|nr:Lsr2 family protein [Streptosporangiaceae bacterium]